MSTIDMSTIDLMGHGLVDASVERNQPNGQCARSDERSFCVEDARELRVHAARGHMKHLQSLRVQNLLERNAALPQSSGIWYRVEELTRMIHN
jgi:hypothetical protein